MLASRPVGRQAPALKYDILTAISVLALTLDKHRQRLMMRLMVLITARYNWQSGELSMGRAEMARLWSVDERTVKRELAKLRTAGWMHVKRAGARGRVTVYEIDLGQLLIDTRPVWKRIGPDFEARMQETQPSQEPDTDPNVVPFAPRVTVDRAGQGGRWGQVCNALQTRDPATYAAWFARLVEVELNGPTVTLQAPSRFVADYVQTHLAGRLLAAYSRFEPNIRVVKVLSED